MFLLRDRRSPSFFRPTGDVVQSQKGGFRPACLQISFAVIRSSVRWRLTGMILRPFESIECFPPSRINWKPFCSRDRIRSLRLTLKLGLDGHLLEKAATQRDLSSLLLVSSDHLS